MPTDRSIRCRDAVALASPSLDAELNPAVLASFRAHVASCTGCRAYLQQMRVTREILRACGDGGFYSFKRGRTAGSP